MAVDVKERRVEEEKMGPIPVKLWKEECEKQETELEEKGKKMKEKSKGLKQTQQPVKSAIFIIHYIHY